MTQVFYLKSRNGGVPAMAALKSEWASPVRIFFLHQYPPPQHKEEQRKGKNILKQELGLMLVLRCPKLSYHCYWNLELRPHPTTRGPVPTTLGALSRCVPGSPTDFPSL